MSTKIYNGFKFNTNNLRVIHKWLMELRKNVQPLAKKSMAKEEASRMTRLIDLGYEEPYLTTEKQLQKELRELKQSSYRNPSIDFEFSVTIHPLANKILGIYYTEQKEFSNLIQTQSWFVDYHYQNQTDPDETVTKKEWLQRKKDWLKVFPTNQKYMNGIPSMNGFVAEIHLQELPTVTLTEVLKYIPSYEFRLDNASQDLLIEKYFKPNSDNTFLSELFEWLELDSTKELKNKIKEQLSGKLKKEITLEDLY